MQILPTSTWPHALAKGVIPGGLFANGIDPTSVTRLETVADMHERKARMYELSDGFIGLPGGLGTFEEVFEAATWTQLGLHRGSSQSKQIVLLDEDGFWDGATALLDRAVDGGVLRTQNRPIVQATSSIDGALEILRSDPTNELPKYVVGQPIDGA